MLSSLGEATPPARELLQVMRRELGKELQALVVSRALSDLLCRVCCWLQRLRWRPWLDTSSSSSCGSACGQKVAV